MIQLETYNDLRTGVKVSRLSSLMHTTLDTIDQTLTPRLLPNEALTLTLLLKAQVLSPPRLTRSTCIVTVTCLFLLSVRCSDYMVDILSNVPCRS